MTSFFSSAVNNKNKEKKTQNSFTPQISRELITVVPIDIAFYKFAMSWRKDFMVLGMSTLK